MKQNWSTFANRFPSCGCRRRTQGKNVLVGRIAGGSRDEFVGFFVNELGQFAEEIQAVPLTWDWLAVAGPVEVDPRVQ